MNGCRVTGSSDGPWFFEWVANGGGGGGGGNEDDGVAVATAAVTGGTTGGTIPAVGT